MDPIHTDRRRTILTLLTFLGVLSVAASAAHFAIVRLAPTSLYVGTLMMTPTLAAFVTLRLWGRRIAELPWRWGSHRANIAGYVLPALYVSIAYGLVWLLGLAGVANPETLDEWGHGLGLSGGSGGSSLAIVALMTALLASVQFIKSLGSIAGEEIGWRGFLVWELRRLFSFEVTCLLSGLLWAVWHYPVIIAYGGGDPFFQLACFTVMLVSMSVIMTYYTFTSGSLWPAVMFHGAHNIYIQKIYTPLTIQGETSGMWIDEYGLMVPIVVTVVAAIYWRRARREGGAASVRPPAAALRVDERVDPEHDERRLTGAERRVDGVGGAGERDDPGAVGAHAERREVEVEEVDAGAGRRLDRHVARAVLEQRRHRVGHLEAGGDVDEALAVVGDPGLVVGGRPEGVEGRGADELERGALAV